MKPTDKDQRCKALTKFGEWICDAPAGHAEGQHYYVRADQ